MNYVYLSDSVKAVRVKEDEKVGVFDVEGLYRGYGLTVGNALRRVLFSSLPGAAITRFKVKGAGHEFTTIPGVVEDMVEVGLNLKQVRFRFHADEPQILTLKVKGEKKVTAGDIKGNAQVEIQNPDSYIATLGSKTAELDMELTVEKGLGYEPVETQKKERLPIGMVAIDAIYSPVVNVNFRIENMRVGERTDYNKVRIEIETDGTISPSSALHKAVNILADHFKKIDEIKAVDFPLKTVKPTTAPKKETSKKSKLPTQTKTKTN